MIRAMIINAQKQHIEDIKIVKVFMLFAFRYGAMKNLSQCI